mgnify:CR=1 FL=1
MWRNLVSFSLVLDAAHAPADVGRHDNYNKSSLGSHSENLTKAQLKKLASTAPVATAAGKKAAAAAK